MRFECCPKCGSKLHDERAGDDGLVPYCGSCGRFWFDAFASCAIVLVHDGSGEVVVAQQSYLSKEFGMFTSGYITPGESAEEAAVREVREELGIEVASLDYVGSYWYAPGDMLMLGFVCRAADRSLRLSGEVDSARWMPEDDIPNEVQPDAAAVGVYRAYMKVRGKPCEWEASF